MNKLKRQDYLFVYMLILSLVFFVAGFYFGGSVIKGKYENKIKEVTTEFESKSKESGKKYLQTDFVTFYYGVLEPFNRLKKEHFSFIDRISHMDQDYNFEEKSKELFSLSSETLTKLTETKIAHSAPLLIESREELIEALEFYQNGIKGILRQESLPMEINRFNEKWLFAQKKFYQAVFEWERIHEGAKLYGTITDNMDLYSFSLDKWTSLSLHNKNYAISILMEKNKINQHFQPEDITIHIDALVRSDAVDRLGISTLGKAIDILIASNSIKDGDYLKEKALYYPTVKTPLIPLYLNQ